MVLANPTILQDGQGCSCCAGLSSQCKLDVNPILKSDPGPVPVHLYLCDLSVNSVPERSFP